MKINKKRLTFEFPITFTNMKSKLFPFLVLFIMPCLFVLQNCGPTDDNDDHGDPCADVTDKYYLSAAAKAQVPYKGNETIIMVSNIGDTIHCIGTGKQFFNTRRFILHGNPACGNHGIESFYEAYKIAFIDSVKSAKIEVTQFERKFFPDGYLPYSQTELYNIVEINFKNTLFYIESHLISNKEIIGPYYFYQTQVGNKLYYNVTKVEKDYFQDSTSFLYINKNNGLIQFSLNQNETWSILN